MAIHPLLPGIEVAICVNKVPLPEYDDDESQPDTITSPTGRPIRTITKYIESTEEQEFSIMCKYDYSYKLESPTLEVKLRIDGTKVQGMTLGPALRNHPNYKTGVSKDGQTAGHGYRLPFIFTKIETTENANQLRTVEADKLKVANSGQIMVEIFRASKPIISPRRGNNIPNLGLAEIHEKALKGRPKYHGAGFGEAKPARVSSTVSKTTCIDGGDSPLVRYTFQYRSNKALKELLIIERTPEPEASAPHASTNGNRGLFDAELISQQQRKIELLKERLREQNPGIKREAVEERQRSRSNKKFKITKSGEIDLTGESDDDIDISSRSRSRTIPQEFGILDLTEA